MLPNAAFISNLKLQQQAGGSIDAASFHKLGLMIPAVAQHDSQRIASIPKLSGDIVGCVEDFLGEFCDGGIQHMVPYLLSVQRQLIEAQAANIYLCLYHLAADEKFPAILHGPVALVAGACANPLTFPIRLVQKAGFKPISLGTVHYAVLIPDIHGPPVAGGALQRGGKLDIHT